MDRMIHEELTERIIAAAFKVHNELGFGFLESVYKNALLIELRKSSVPAVAEVPLDVFYRGEPVGKYFADVIVDGKIILELKSVEHLSVQHEIQLVNYLKATGMETGLLLNFGTGKVEIKRKFLHPNPVHPS